MRTILALAICVASISSAISKPPSPSGRDGNEHPIQITDQSHHERAKDDRGTDERPIVVKTISGPKTKEASEQEEAERESKSPSDWWVVASTVWIAFVTTLLAYYTARLYGSTKQLAEDTAINGATQLSVAEKTARAYLAMMKIEPSIFVDQQTGAYLGGSITCFWKNGGASPAKRVRYYTSWEPRKGDLPQGFDFPDNGTPYIDPAHGFLGADADTTTLVESIPAATVAELIAGQIHLFVWGWAEYDDVITPQIRRRTEFCVQIDGAASIDGGAILKQKTVGRFNATDHDCYRQPQTA